MVLLSKHEADIVNLARVALTFARLLNYPPAEFQGARLDGRQAWVEQIGALELNADMDGLIEILVVLAHCAVLQES